MLQYNIFKYSEMEYRYQLLSTEEEFSYREEGIKEIEKDMEQINEIFRDISYLTQVQGRQLDTIEAHMTFAEENVGKGEKELRNASRYQKKSHEKQWALLGVVTGIAGVLGLTLGLKLK